MRTEDLIAELSAQPAKAFVPVERSVAVGLALGLALILPLFLIVLGPRTDLAAAFWHPAVAAKTVLPLLLGFLALALVLRATRPGARMPAALGAIWLVPLGAAALFGWAFLVTPPEERLAAFLGQSIAVCLPSITLLSVPVAVLVFRALRLGAPTRPARCGALAGLAASGFAAALYSAYCVEDSALFYAFWYPVSIGIVTLAGAFAGARFLRW